MALKQYLLSAAAAAAGVPTAAGGLFAEEMQVGHAEHGGRD